VKYLVVACTIAAICWTIGAKGGGSKYGVFCAEQGVCDIVGAADERRRIGLLGLGSRESVCRLSGLMSDWPSLS
jgi:hypothetical protein